MPVGLVKAVSAEQRGGSGRRAQQCLYLLYVDAVSLTVMSRGKGGSSSAHSGDSCEDAGLNTLVFSNRVCVFVPNL